MKCVVADIDGAAEVAVERSENSQKRGLPTARRAGNRNGFSAGYGKRYIAKGRNGLPAFFVDSTEVLYVNQGSSWLEVGMSVSLHETDFNQL